MKSDILPVFVCVCFLEPVVHVNYPGQQPDPLCAGEPAATAEDQPARHLREGARGLCGHAHQDQSCASHQGTVGVWTCVSWLLDDA